MYLHDKMTHYNIRREVMKIFHSYYTLIQKISPLLGLENSQLVHISNITYILFQG